jgi:hypothetical protein
MMWMMMARRRRMTKALVNEIMLKVLMLKPPFECMNIHEMSNNDTSIIMMPLMMMMMSKGEKVMTSQ